jgi:hypothetical protein
VHSSACLFFIKLKDKTQQLRQLKRERRHALQTFAAGTVLAAAQEVALKESGLQRVVTTEWSVDMIGSAHVFSARSPGAGARGPRDGLMSVVVCTLSAVTSAEPGTCRCPSSLVTNGPGMTHPSVSARVVCCMVSVAYVTNNPAVAWAFRSYQV